MTTISENAKAIFLEAVEKHSPEDWPEFLGHACDDDRDLRGMVEGLLLAHAEKDSLFDQVGETRDYRPLVRAGQTIGPYKIREQIGDGGMGVVYVAEQEKPLRRKVALKVIKPGMDSKAVLARFDAERNALALMNHPNIAKVLDAGTTEQGHPYFVMELIQGKPITEYCDQKKLTISGRLELFTQVCNAVQHAHQKGVIHRDIKPSNILVTEIDGKPVPKVIDFGIAKALGANLTDRTVYTSYQSLVGTPLYMSPEQTQLSGVDVDTSSDVYSLGILLYELLTGTTPLSPDELKQAAQDEVLRRIRETEPPRPSYRISSLGETSSQVSECRGAQPEQLGRLVRGDLDWIVMRALEKNRNRRYKTADAFAADIGRHLADEPVEARPPSTAYRLSRFYRRNKGLVGVGGFVLLVVVVATVFVTSAWLETRTQNKVAEQRRREAEEQSARAEAALEELQDSVASLREATFQHGVSLILNANEDDAEMIVAKLQENADDQYSETLQAVLYLHTRRFNKAVEILEELTDKQPDDVGLLAMLTDAYDGQGDIDTFVRTHDVLLSKLKHVDPSTLSTIELVYVALANIAAPKHGYDYAARALESDQGSHYARLIRGKMAASFVLRSGLQLGPKREQELIQQAIADVDSLRLLYEFDSRIPSHALATHVLVAKALQANGDSSWIGHLADAEPIVDYLESRSRTGWEDYFLAAYYSELGREGLLEGGREKALNAYKNASVDRDGKLHDYAACYYVASACELGVDMDPQVKQAIKSSESSVYGWRGLGLSYVISGNESAAQQSAEELRARQSDDAKVYAAEIYMLLGMPNDAISILKELSEVDGSEARDASKWYRQALRKFYLSQLEDDGEYTPAMLVNSAKDSDYSRWNLSFAYWAIAVTAWNSEHGLDGRDRVEWLKLCEAQHQISFPQLVWSRALISGIEGQQSQ